MIKKIKKKAYSPHHWYNSSPYLIDWSQGPYSCFCLFYFFFSPWASLPWSQTHGSHYRLFWQRSRKTSSRFYWPMHRQWHSRPLSGLGDQLCYPVIKAQHLGPRSFEPLSTSNPRFPQMRSKFWVRKFFCWFVGHKFWGAQVGGQLGVLGEGKRGNWYLACSIVHYHYRVRVFIVCVGDRSESFLACGVPLEEWWVFDFGVEKLQFGTSRVCRRCSWFWIWNPRRLCSRRYRWMHRPRFLVGFGQNFRGYCKSHHQRRFSDAGTSDNHEFEQVVTIFG